MYRQLTFKERCQIEIYLQAGHCVSRMARKLKRARSTISLEISRQHSMEEYCAEDAHMSALERRNSQRRMPRRIPAAVWARVERHLAQRWSPEQISGVLKNEGIDLSHEWIYQYIFKNKRQNGKLYINLRRGGRKYNKRSATAGCRLIRNRVGIEDRPAVVEERSRVGDWEGDLVLGKENTGAVLTLVERKTRFTKLKSVKRKTAAQTNIAILKAFTPIKKYLLSTLTFDNGKEFSWHEHITNYFGIAIYFARPYHSWERGLNENTNGLLRQYLPKGTSFADLTDEHLQWIENELNDRPRKCLGFKTPRQMMEIAMAA